MRKLDLLGIVDGDLAPGNVEEGLLGYSDRKVLGDVSGAELGDMDGQALASANGTPLGLAEGGLRCDCSTGRCRGEITRSC